MESDRSCCEQKQTVNIYHLLIVVGAAVYEKEINHFIRIICNIKLARGLSALVTKLVVMNYFSQTRMVCSNLTHFGWSERIFKSATGEICDISLIIQLNLVPRSQSVRGWEIWVRDYI